MMPVIDGAGQPEHQIDYKQKYKALKKKLKFLVYEQECFLEELRRAQRRLLKVSRDRSFLLDRLLGYEKINESSEDSDATASSDSEGEGHKDGSGVRRKKGSSATPSGLDPSSLHIGLGFAGLGQGHSLLGPPKKKQKIGMKKTNKPHGKTQKGGTVKDQMTREELERHLDSKKNKFGIEKAPAKLPMEIFSNENSSPDRSASFPFQ
ncbi:hypothetical protein CHS0354_038886 [Potamilus streckersoni]|uniref:INO80 complex subunit E N-terminal domain-containing protein n=1 Tax=Potamilus streckersoni TaxID=2493646 RepID=A0AAE0SQT7_9BIVA|nr:hypothetical protein CHS0354_038886 [Potamilus streckersoni]